IILLYLLSLRISLITPHPLSPLFPYTTLFRSIIHTTLQGGINVKIVSIEPTPSPHSMKINVDERLPDGQKENYQIGDDLHDAPDYVQKLFVIAGVKGLYRVIDFVTIQRNPRVAWEDILPEVQDVFGTSKNMDENLSFSTKNGTEDSFGEIHVYIQMFRDLPMQVKLEEGDQEYRFGLPERFTEA